VDRYEELRGQALGALAAKGNGLGLALFIRQGMPAWLDAWAEHVREPDSARTAHSTLTH
jgi:hypothetical protein